MIRPIFVEIHPHLKRYYFLQSKVLQSLIKVLFSFLKKRGHPASYSYGEACDGSVNERYQENSVRRRTQSAGEVGPLAKSARWRSRPAGEVGPLAKSARAMSAREVMHHTHVIVDGLPPLVTGSRGEYLRVVGIHSDG